MNKNTLLYAGLIIFGLAGAFIFPAYKLQIIISLYFNCSSDDLGCSRWTDGLQHIWKYLFFGVGMYVASSTQIAMFFHLAEWTDAGWRKNFCSYYPSIFSRFWSRNIISRNYSNNNCWSNWLWDFRFKRTLLCNLYFRH